jgi:hypothetical protein
MELLAKLEHPMPHTMTPSEYGRWIEELVSLTSHTKLDRKSAERLFL